MNNLSPHTSSNDRHFLNNSNGTTNHNDNSGTADIKLCALLLNNSANWPVMMNDG